MLWLHATLPWWSSGFDSLYPHVHILIRESILTGNLDHLIVKPEVTLLGWTTFNAEAAGDLTGWETDAEGGEALAEFAGRACYQSWSKPNPATATNSGYLKNIIELGHGSVLEHGMASFYLTGVSRGFSHEIVRHRHTSKSQLSQRYVDQAAGMENGNDNSEYGVVIPPAYRDDILARDWVLRNYLHCLGTYENLVEREVRKLRALGVASRDARIQARQAARCVLPNCAETRIVLTGNFLAWRELIAQRATAHADAEMREVAVMIAECLKISFPNAFQDMRFEKVYRPGVSPPLETVVFS